MTEALVIIEGIKLRDYRKSEPSIDVYCLSVGVSDSSTHYTMAIVHQSVSASFSHE